MDENKDAGARPDGHIGATGDAMPGGGPGIGDVGKPRSPDRIITSSGETPTGGTPEGGYADRSIPDRAVRAAASASNVPHPATPDAQAGGAVVQEE